MSQDVLDRGLARQLDELGAQMLLEGPTGTSGPCCQLVPNIVRDVTDCDGWHAGIMLRMQADCKQSSGLPICHLCGQRLDAIRARQDVVEEGQPGVRREPSGAPVIELRQHQRGHDEVFSAVRE